MEGDKRVFKTVPEMGPEEMKTQEEFKRWEGKKTEREARRKNVLA